MCTSAAKSNTGFSLLEVVLVIAIIVVVAAIAAPRFGTARGRYQADLAARRIIADLGRAQSTAKAGSTNCTVGFYTATETYVLEGVPSLDGGAGNCTVDLTVQPYEADLVSADFGGNAKVAFDGWGLPSAGGTVVITVGSEQRAVVLDAETGEATVQ